MEAKSHKSSSDSGRKSPAPDQATRATGDRGEEAACTYLTRKGYTILDRNFRAGRFEIDIIARTGDIIVFCEVKTTRTRRFGSPITWVTGHKISRIAQAAREYLQANPVENVSYRFDIIGLDVTDGRVTVDHRENAFIAPEGE